MTPAPRRLVAAVLAASTLAASSCAPRPESITARYVSPAAYRVWQCDDLADELGRLEAERIRLFGVQANNADASAGVAAGGATLSAGMMVAGAALAIPTFGWSLLLIPAGLATGATVPAAVGATTTDRRDEYSRVLGEIEAINISRREKSCQNRLVGSAPVPSYVVPAPTPAPGPSPVPASTPAAAVTPALPPVTPPTRTYASTTGFSCPPAGTSWIVNDVTFRSEGADPADPTICI